MNSAENEERSRKQNQSANRRESSRHESSGSRKSGESWSKIRRNQVLAKTKNTVFKEDLQATKPQYRPREKSRIEDGSNESLRKKIGKVNRF